MHEKILPKSEILETEFNFALNSTDTAAQYGENTKFLSLEMKLWIFKEFKP